MKSNLILFLLFYFNLNTLFAQNFERVENTIGLGVLEENNGVAVADYDGDLDLDQVTQNYNATKSRYGH